MGRADASGLETRIKVYYPSGNKFSVVGKWIGGLDVDGEETVAITMETPSKSAFLGDPRGVYVDDQTGAVLYNPLMQAHISQWVIDWLREHHEWPVVAEIPGVIGPQDVMGKGTQVPGALINGTLVIKINSLLGDSHQDGDRGKVVGSELIAGAVWYFVEWNDLPGMPVAITRERLMPEGK